MYEADRPEVTHARGAVLLRQQGDHGRVEVREIASSQVVKVLENRHDIVLADAPAGPEEGTRETIRPRRPVRGRGQDRCPDFRFGERVVEANVLN